MAVAHDRATVDGRRPRGAGTIFDTDRFRKGGFQPERAWANVRRVYDRTLEVFSIADSGAAYYLPSLDISDEVVKRLDAIKK